jgi:hypothetical protein
MDAHNVPPNTHAESKILKHLLVSFLSGTPLSHGESKALRNHTVGRAIEDNELVDYQVVVYILKNGLQEGDTYAKADWLHCEVQCLLAPVIKRASPNRRALRRRTLTEILWVDRD